MQISSKAKVLREWEWTVDIEYEPVPKGRPRFTAQGRPYTPPKTRIAENDIQLLIAAQAPEEPFEGPLAVRMIFYMTRPDSQPKRKRPYPHVKPDLDNLVKLIKDACQVKKDSNQVARKGALWVNDSMICEIIAYKRYADNRHSGVTISIYQLKKEDI